MKTPEELAKEWYSQMLKSGRDPLGDEGFLAGYKAAQEQFADVGKVMANTPEKPDGWISVKDRLPQIDTPVMLYTGHEYEIGRLEEDGEFSIWVDYRYGGEMAADQFTHWMPLPEPPKP